MDCSVLLDKRMCLRFGRDRLSTRHFIYSKNQLRTRLAWVVIACAEPSITNSYTQERLHVCPVVCRRLRKILSRTPLHVIIRLRTTPRPRNDISRRAFLVDGHCCAGALLGFCLVFWRRLEINFFFGFPPRINKRYSSLDLSKHSIPESASRPWASHHTRHCNIWKLRVFRWSVVYLLTSSIPRETALPSHTAPYNSISRFESVKPRGMPCQSLQHCCWFIKEIYTLPLILYSINIHTTTLLPKKVPATIHTLRAFSCLFGFFTGMIRSSACLAADDVSIRCVSIFCLIPGDFAECATWGHFLLGSDQHIQHVISNNLHLFFCYKSLAPPHEIHHLLSSISTCK